MPRQPISFIKGDRIGVETDYRDALPVNMYAVANPVFGADGYMIQYPGLTEVSNINSRCFGGIWNERFSEHYRVADNSLFKINNDGAVQKVGSLNCNSSVSLPYSFNTQGIIADNRFYLYDPSDGLTEVVDPELGNPIDGVWVDGYYFMTDGDFLFHTDINDESSIDPLKFATAEFMPDPSLGLGKTQDNKVVVFGRYTTEYFVNVAQEDFAFQRIATRALKTGIVGTHCKAESGGKWFTLGGSKEQAISCFAISVGSVAKIASREIDKIIGSYTELELQSSIVEAYSEDGTSFVVYHLPNHTLLFNETIAAKAGIDQAWSILKTDALGDSVWRGVHFVFDVNKGKWTVGDKTDGSVGVLDETTALTYGDISEWILYTPFYSMESGSINELEVETIPGHTGSNDATVFVSLSYNGLTYGQEWTEMYGSPNDYGKRFIIRRLGYIRDWFGVKLRGATRSRMAFSMGTIDFG